MWIAARRFFVATTLAALVSVPAVRAQSTRTWTGLAAPDKNWTTLGNWNTGVPVSGDTALFNSAGNGNINIGLGGATQPIKAILFDTGSAAAYGVGDQPGDKFNFDVGGSITVNSTVTTQQWIHARTQTNGLLTVTNNGPLSGGLSLGGNVTIGGGGTLTVNNPLANARTSLIGSISENSSQPGSLSLLATNTGPANNNNFVFYGVNTYTGGTQIQVNTGSGGSIQIGNDHAFGTGPVTVNLVAGAIAPQFSVLDGLHALANPFNLNSGMTFVGVNSLAFTGPLTIINSLAGGTRSFNNSITTAGKSVFFGDTPNQSTITLGNPIANGGDNIGKTAIFNPAAGSMTVINHVMQDPAAGGGAASGSVQYTGSSGGVVLINGANTYTGGTLLNGPATIRFGTDYNTGDLAGPFGLGTITANNASNSILQPIDGDRSIANPISMVFGITVANAPGDNSSLTLTGPISMAANGRTITNNFSGSGGTLRLGSAASPSTITLPNTASQTFTIAGIGKTIINDVIQNPTPVPSPAAAVNITATGTVALNGQNTYTGETFLNGSGTTIRIGTSSNALPGPSFTAGPFGVGTVTPNNAIVQPVLQPFGADRTIANAINMTYGFWVANPLGVDDPTGPHNLTLTGPITLGASGRIITNNMVPAVALTLGSAATPSTISLGSTLTFQSINAVGGKTIINDTMSGIGGLTVQNSALVHLNSLSNNYAGVTTITGTGSPKLLVNGSKTGAGTVTVGGTGTLGGSGSIAGAITNNGIIAPGNDGIGTLTATGNVTFGGSSRLAIELSNTLADKLVVGGNLNLPNAEFLDISGLGSGTSWVIASYTGTLSGTFNTVPAGYTVNYGTGSNSQITLSIVPTGLKGDFNNDSHVNAADYLIWRMKNGTNNALYNDNGLGTPITTAHLNLWRSNYANPPGSGNGLDGSGTVPEPTSMLLAILSAIAFTGVRRRRNGRKRVSLT
jgi:hypothetical protein